MVFHITFERMKARNVVIIALLLLSGLFSACKKTGFTDSPNAFVFTSADTLHFDTVFTSVGSITQSFKIFNANDQQLRISNIELSGGSASFFKMNVDGTAGTSFSNVEVAANDSIYVFVAVTIDPDNNTNPFIIQDSIKIAYNGRETFVQLDAYGQNAVFLKNAVVTKDTVWKNTLPVVIKGTLNVSPSSTLSIEKGTNIYCHADANITVDGTLKAIGEKYDSTRIVFRNDRLDEYYKDLPAGWQGITFSNTSVNNELAFVSVLNATNGLVVRDPATNNNPKLTLEQCIINNASNTGIFAAFSSIKAVNCLISNCGQNLQIAAGGDYHFDHCTIVSYSNRFLSHQAPVLAIKDYDDNDQVFPLDAMFTNCIIYGDDGFVTDEISTLQKGTNSFVLTFENVLYKGSPVANATFTNSLQNQDPAFLLIDAFDNNFDFHLQEFSPCINTGVQTSTLIDLDGKNRADDPDIGCYEYGL